MLARLLLHELVGDAISRELVAHDHTKTVVRREASLVIGGKISESRAVVEVLRHDGIQVMGSGIGTDAGRENVFPRGVLALRKRSRRIETPSGDRHLAVKAGLGVLEGV